MPSTLRILCDGDAAAAPLPLKRSNLAVNLDRVEQCWKDAFEIHHRNLAAGGKRTKSAPYDTATMTCSIETLLAEAKTAQAECKANPSRPQKAFEEIAISIEKYASTGNLRSEITAPVWGLFKIIIGVAAKKIFIADFIWKNLIWLPTHLKICEDRIRISPDDPLVLQSARQDFAAAIMFLDKTCSHCKRGTLAQYCMSISSELRETLEGSVSSMTRFSNLGQDALITRAVSMQFALMDTQQKVNEDHRVFIAATSGALEKLKIANMTEHAVSLLPSARQAEADIASPTDGTCMWLFENERFKEWMSSGFENVLWIHGISGSGKSVMAAYLRCKIATDFSIFYSLSNLASKSSSNAKSITGSIVAQLLDQAIQRQDSGTIEKITEPLAACNDINQCRPIQLWSIFRDAVETIPRCTIIIDAIDEFRDTSMSLEIGYIHHIVGDLKRLCKRQRGGEFKVVILSQNHLELKMMIADSVNIEIHSNTKGDIRRFTDCQIAKYPQLASIQPEIYAKVDSYCGGMFRWVASMMESLSLAHTKLQQLQTLEMIPRDLLELYEQRAEWIKASEDKKWRRNILSILLASRRPLRLEDLSEALKFDHGCRLHVDQQLRDVKRTISQTCEAFVSIGQDGVILSHSVVEAFLLRPERDTRLRGTKYSIHMTRDDSNIDMARKCFALLSEARFRDPDQIAYWLYRNFAPDDGSRGDHIVPLDDPFRELVFYDYAVNYWSFHLRAVADPPSDLLEQANTFLHGNEFVRYAEYYAFRNADIGKFSEIWADLKSWYLFLPPKSQALVMLDDYFSFPYRHLSKSYKDKGTDKVLEFLCLYRLGDFYTLTADVDAQYEVKKTVAKGLTKTLGQENPLTLRARASLGICYIVRGELDKALREYREVSDIQREKIGTDKPDYYESLMQVVSVQFLMTDFLEAQKTSAEVIDGLKRTVGTEDRVFLVGYSFDGLVNEALGRLDDALANYKYVYETREKSFGRNNPITIYAEINMASIYRKKEEYELAIKDLEYAFHMRQQIWGLENFIVIDVAIQLIILYRDAGRLEDAQARLDLISQKEVKLQPKWERYCQAEHLRGLLLDDEEKTEEACGVLRKILYTQAKKGREFNIRALLWLRLDLAYILRRNEKGRFEAAKLFDGLVQQDLDEADSGGKHERIQKQRERRIAEKALRLVRDRKRGESEELLKRESLRWVREKDFWLFDGGPAADTATMRAPREPETQATGEQKRLLVNVAGEFAKQEGLVIPKTDSVRSSISWMGAGSNMFLIFLIFILFVIFILIYYGPD